MSLGNNSRNALSWIGGPKHEIRDQRIPGYTGFIPGVQAENLFSKSYSRCAAKSLNGTIMRGADLSPDRKYVSQTMKEYSPVNFRRIVERPELASKKDYVEYSATINVKENEQRQRLLESSMSDIQATSDYYHDPSNVTISPMKT